MKQDKLTLNLFIICFWTGDCKLINDLNYEYIIEQRNFKAMKDCFPEEYYSDGIVTNCECGRRLSMDCPHNYTGESR